MQYAELRSVVFFFFICLHQKTAFDTLGRALMGCWRLGGDKCVKEKALAAQAPQAFQ